MFWEITKILAFFGTLSKGSEKAPFYFVFFPHCTSPRFRVSYSMYLNIGCNYIVVLSVLDRRYIGDIGAFFPNNASLVLLIIYAIGILLAVVMARLFPFQSTGVFLYSSLENRCKKPLKIKDF